MPPSRMPAKSREDRFEKMLHRIIKKCVTKEEFEQSTLRHEFPRYEDLLKEEEEEYNEGGEEEGSRTEWGYEDEDEEEEKDDEEDNESDVDDLQAYYNALTRSGQARVEHARILFKFDRVNDIVEVDIRKRYRKQALLYHPDRPSGGDADKFKEIEAARTTLLDFIALRM